MATITQRRDVRFYDVFVEVADDDGKVTEKKVKSDFWPKTFKRLEKLKSARSRVITISRNRYFGTVHHPTSPAIDHLQVGRLRNLSEHIETTDMDSGEVELLELGDPNKRVSEPTFVVPIATKTRVAIFSPGRVTRHETIANWLTVVLDLPKKGRSIRFRPVVDEEALARILNAQGAVSVEFNMDADQPVPTGDHDVPLLDAVDSLLTSGPSMGTLTVGWSLGIGGGTLADRNMIQKLALKIATGDFAKRATVNLVVEDEDGNLHRETHKIFEDQIVETVSYDVDADSPSSDEVVLVAIGQAIAEFRKRRKKKNDATSNDNAAV